MKISAGLASVPEKKAADFLSGANTVFFPDLVLFLIGCSHVGFSFRDLLFDFRNSLEFFETSSALFGLYFRDFNFSRLIRE